MPDPWSEPAVTPRPDGPLAGRRILITRPRTQASALAGRLAHLGAATILLPVLELVPPASFAPLDAALARLSTFDWVILTSANAADALAARLPPGSTIRRLAVIGAATLARTRELALPTPTDAPILLPPKSIAESLADALEPPIRTLVALQGTARVLLPRAEQARDILPDRLRAAGADLSVVPAYRNQVPAASAPLLRTLLANPQRWPHAIPFTSSSSVTGLLALATLPDAILRISIGPVTSATLREHNLPPHAEAAQPTVDALAAAVLGTLRP